MPLNLLQKNIHLFIYLPEGPSIFKIGLSQALAFQPSTQLTLLAWSCALRSAVPLAQRWLSGDRGYVPVTPGLLPLSGQDSICRHRSCCRTAAVYHRGVCFNISSWEQDRYMLSLWT